MHRGDCMQWGTCSYVCMYLQLSLKFCATEYIAYTVHSSMA